MCRFGYSNAWSYCRFIAIEETGNFRKKDRLGLEQYPKCISRECTVITNDHQYGLVFPSREAV